MLRASSLGLSFPSSTIFVASQCRRLCGARNRLALVRNGRNITNITSPKTYSPASPGPKHEQEDTDEKLRDVAPHPALPGGERDIGQSASLASSETVVEKETYSAPAGAPSHDADPPDLALEFERETFMALIQEELESAGILSEIPSTFAWTPTIGAKPRPTDAIKPVEISKSLYAPLTQLIADLKTAHQKVDVHGTVEDDAHFAAPDLLQPPEPIPPRDTGAQIWKNLQILGRTMSPDDAWIAYVYLIDTLSDYPHVQDHIPQIPFSHLHRFCRLLSRHQPKTYRQFLRLLSVLIYIKHCGGELKQWALNALVDIAGKGWRKTHKAVIAKQMGVLSDLLASRMPGSSEYTLGSQQLILETAFKPDAYTLTSLVAVAARGGNSTMLRELSGLMNNFRIVPNRVTHIAMLRYYERKCDLIGLRATLQRMRQLNIDLGLEGLNACIFAYSKLAKPDVVLMIYQLLRHNMIPKEYRGDVDIIQTEAQLAEEFIFVEEDIVPDSITYVSVIQSMAYHGYFRATMDVFIDMLSLAQGDTSNSVEPTSSPPTEPPLVPRPSLDTPPSSDSGSPPTEPYSYSAEFDPQMKVYRAIFLGFARHAIKPSQFRNSKKDWTLANLQNLFNRFLCLPADTHVTPAQLWIIMDAFGRTSDWDYDELRQVWVAIDMRFGIQLHKPDGHSALARLRRKLFPGSVWRE